MCPDVCVLRGGETLYKVRQRRMDIAAARYQETGCVCVFVGSLTKEAHAVIRWKATLGEYMVCTCMRIKTQTHDGAAAYDTDEDDESVVVEILAQHEHARVGGVSVRGVAVFGMAVVAGG